MSAYISQPIMPMAHPHVGWGNAQPVPPTYSIDQGNQAPYANQRSEQLQKVATATHQINATQTPQHPYSYPTPSAPPPTIRRGIISPPPARALPPTPQATAHSSYSTSAPPPYTAAVSPYPIQSPAQTLPSSRPPSYPTPSAPPPTLRGRITPQNGNLGVEAQGAVKRVSQETTQIDEKEKCLVQNLLSGKKVSFPPKNQPVEPSSSTCLSNERVQPLRQECPAVNQHPKILSEKELKAAGVSQWEIDKLMNRPTHEKEEPSTAVLDRGKIVRYKKSEIAGQKAVMAAAASNVRHYTEQGRYADAYATSHFITQYSNSIKTGAIYR